MSDLSIQDRSGEKNLVLRRTLVAFLGILTLTSILLWRLFDLQIIQHEVFETMSLSNRVQGQDIPPTRGLIYDRNGNLLAENLPSHNLSLVMERVKDLDYTLGELRKIVEITEHQERRFRSRLRKPRRPYEPVPVKFKLSEIDIAKLAANSYFLEGVEVEATLIRRYPYEGSFAHVLGYVGRINEKELKELNPERYAGTGFIGKLGIEKTYEQYLLGEVGYRTVETNARGRILRVLEETPPQPGVDLYLHLDLELQQAAEKALEGKRGAIVAMDVKTGGILAMVSTPSFDPNLFVTGISTKDYSALRDSIDVPFLNRATRGLYPPASTIKPFLAMGGLASGVTTWERLVADPGVFYLPNHDRPFRDWKVGGHHPYIGLADSIIESCDVYFYDLAYNMKLEAMNDILDQFGFGKNTTVDVHNPKSGINPSREWKKKRHGFAWFAGDSVNMGIGQGYMLASPMQITIATMVMANKGVWKAPKLLMHSTSETLNKIRDPKPDDIVMEDPEDWDKMHKAMHDVVHGKRGTARATGAGSKFKMAGKTGTAQVKGIAQDEEYDAEAIEERHRDHAWFAGFAPYDDPQIAVTVFVENGEHGSWMAPVARQMFENWLLRTESTDGKVSVPEPVVIERDLSDGVE